MRKRITEADAHWGYLVEVWVEDVATINRYVLDQTTGLSPDSTFEDAVRVAGRDLPDDDQTFISLHRLGDASLPEGDSERRWAALKLADALDDAADHGLDWETLLWDVLRSEPNGAADRPVVP